jgi:hypothetical protein
MAVPENAKKKWSLWCIHGKKKSMASAKSHSHLLEAEL